MTREREIQRQTDGERHRERKRDWGERDTKAETERQRQWGPVSYTHLTLPTKIGV